MGPGEIVGEMSMLDHGPRTATITAKTPMRVFAIGAATFAMFVDEPAIGRGMATQLAGRLRDVQLQP